MTACELLFTDIIYPIAEDYSQWTRGDLAVSDGVIAGLGPGLSFEAARRITQPDLILLAGLFNLHTHGHDLLWRGARDDAGVDRQWPEWFWSAYDSITLEAHLSAARVTYLTNLLGGVTYVVDHLRRPLPGAPFLQTMQEVGLHGRAHSHLAGAAGDPLVIPHETSIHFEEALDAAAELDRRPIIIHAQETERRLEKVYQLFQRSTVEVLDERGLLHDQTFLVHMGHHSEADVDLMSRRGAHIVVTPAAEMKLGERRCDPVVMERRGVSILVGTDGPAYQNGEDLFLDLKLLALQAAQTHGPGSLAPGRILALATAKPANALGMPHAFPRAGNAANLILLNGRDLGMLPLVKAPFENVARQVIHGGSRAAVRHVLVDGRLVVENGVATRMDAAQCVAAFHTHAARYFHLY